MSTKSSTAFVNGRIYTVNPPQTWAEAFIVGPTGTFTNVGSSQSISEVARKGNLHTLDLGGAFIMPGIHDAHTHLLSAALQQLNEVAIGVDSTEKTIVARLKDGECQCKYANVYEDWVLANFYSADAFQDGRPDRKYLDDAFPDRPVVIRDTFAHNIFVNTEALKRAGYDPENCVDPHGGHFIRREDGQITGELIESTTTKVWLKVPSPAIDHAARAILYAMKINNQYGITSCQEASANTVYLKAAQQLEQADQITCDLHTHIVCAPATFAWEELDSLHALLEVADQYKSKRVATRFVKFWMDGAPHPDHMTQCQLQDGSPDQSKLLIDWDTLLEALERYDARGYTCKLHCAGEGSTRKALDAIEIVRKKNPSGPKHELAHLNSVHKDDQPRFASLRVTAEMSPAIFHLSEVIAAANGHLSWPFEELLASGAPMTIGSDWFLPPTPNLFPAISALVPRLGAETVLRLITIAGAEAVGRADEIGSIEVGKKSNFIQLDRDLSTGEDFADATVLKTWYEGSLVWDKDAATAADGKQEK